MLRAKDVETRLRENFGAVAPTLIGGFVETMQLIRDSFGGDLDLWLVYSAVLLRSVSSPEFKAMSLDAYAAGALPEVLGTNGKSIADSLSIPRETVRRKVNELIELGLVERNARGVVITAKAARELTPVRDRTIRLAVQYYLLARDSLEAAAAR